MKNPEKLFDSKVDKSGECWIWTGCKARNGYGHLGVNGKTVSAHRYSYELAFGKIGPNLCVCHRCDNRACVNPAHLFLGTYADNNRDMHSKGRATIRRGKEIPSAKLNDDTVKRIIELHRTDNYGVRQLGRLFNISHTQIMNVVNRRTWKHVEV